MERLYNPDLMPEAEIKATFVARQGVVDEIVSLIKHQPKGAGVQHVVVIAPRGMGKTTVLLMVRFAIQDSELAKHWQAIQFPEERYNIYDLADFWVEILEHLEETADDSDLQQQVKCIKREYPNNSDLQEAALALIKDWCRKHKKRLIVLADNFNLILEQINDERDNARLRDVLMNDGTIMLIGGATTFFHEARAYNQPLYNFFKIYELPNLKFDQMQELLRRRATLDKQTNFEKTLKANAIRLRVLEHFTGGNPRLVLMLYRVVTQSDISKIKLGLEKLLDEVTPYYKAKVESLPPQQRKILDHIARVSSQTNEGLTPTEIANATRMTPNQASAQLKRLSENGYVQAANLRGRSSYYTLSERLYAIWYQMRFGRAARQRMQWLVDFLKVWYDVGELGTENKRLEARFIEHLNAGRLREAHDALEDRRYLAEAMPDLSARAKAIDGIVCGYLDLKDTATLKKELLANVNLGDLSDKTLNRLRKESCISKGDLHLAKTSRAKSSAPTSNLAHQKAEATAATALGIEAVSAGQMDEALQHFDRALKIYPDFFDALYNRSAVLYDLNRYEEVIVTLDRALKIKPHSYESWSNRASALNKLGKTEEALLSYDRALEINPNSYSAWHYRGHLLYDQKRYEEALTSFEKATELAPAKPETWNDSGDVLDKLGKCEEAILRYDHALKIDPKNVRAWSNRSLRLFTLGRYEEALTSLNRALKIDPNDYKNWSRQGSTLSSLGRLEEAIASFDRALEINPEAADAWHSRGHILNDLERYEEALASFENSLKIRAEQAELWLDCGANLDRLGKSEAAVASFDRALALNPNYSLAWSNRGIALSKLSKYKEALASLDRALEIDAVEETWLVRGTVLYHLKKYEEAIISCERALEVNPDSIEAWRSRAFIYLVKFVRCIKQDNIDLARQNWTEALKSAKRIKDWRELAFSFLLRVTKGKHLRFIRDVIANSDELEEQLFPLVRAIDYILKGDDALIEKLSPEVRGIVEEVVNKFRSADSQILKSQKSRPKELKSGSQYRRKH